MERRSAGWYADPVRVGAARYWNGRAWTDVVSWGGSTMHDPTPLAAVERSAAESDANAVIEYLSDAARRGVVDACVVEAVRRDVGRDRRADTASSPWPAPRSEIATPARSAATRPASDAPRSERPVVTTGAVSRLPAPERAQPLEPGRVARWWSEARHAVRSDLALHGLAYLGVLLLFAGVTGLIVFSFGDVAPWVRTLSEVLVPTAMFVAAWYLRRRGAVVVGSSLALLGGVVTPIIVAASLTDGAPVPPDPTGRALPIVQGVSVALVAVVMAIVVRRRPSSPLRFLVGPVAWLAAGIAAGVGRDPVPTGSATARPESMQLAVVLATLAATMLLVRRRRWSGALARATSAVALPVAGVTYVLELVVAGNEGWPIASTVVVGVASLLLLELRPQQLTTETTSILQFLVIATAAARLSASASPGWVAAVAAIVLLAFLEYVGRRRPTPAAIVVGLVSTGCAFLATLGDPWPVATAFGVLTCWGLWRYVVPADWLPFRDHVGAVPAIAATVTTGAVSTVSDRGVTLVVTSALLLLLALAGRRWQRVRDDVFWRWFVPAAASAVSAVSVTLPWGDASIEVAVATALSAAALLASGAPVIVRAWLGAAIALWSLANLGAALDLGRNVQAIVLALAATTLTIGSIMMAGRTREGRDILLHLPAIGHVIGVIALVVATWPGWAAAAVVAAATLGWWAATVADQVGEAAHLAALRAALSAGSAYPGADPRLVRAVDDVAPLVSIAGTWATVLLVVDAAGWVGFGDPWLAAVSAAVALAAATGVRLVQWRRARRHVLEWSTFVVAVSSVVASLSTAGSDPDQWSPVVALALGIAVVGVTTAPRPVVFTWSAWAGSAMSTVLLLDRVGVARDWADIVLAGWGAAALLGGLSVNRVRHGAVPAGQFVRDPLLRAPTALGAIAFLLGGTLGLAHGSETAIGWTAAALAIVVVAVALLLPLGALLAVAEALATTAYVLVAPWEPLERPWTLVPWMLVLLFAALATRRSGPWSLSRWDLPSFLVAHGVAGLALISAFPSDTVTATCSSLGAVSFAVGIVLRRSAWAGAGAVLVLIAAADAGPGWLALVLLVEGLGLTLAGLRQRDVARWVLSGLGAGSLTAAWFSVAAWQSWAVATVVYVTAPAAATVALVAAAWLRSSTSLRELCLVWMAAGSLVAAGVAWAGSGEITRHPGGSILAASLVLLAAAAGVGATELGGGMRWVSAALAAGAWIPAAWAAEPSAFAATLFGTAVALAGTAAVLAAHGLRPTAVWIPPAAFHLAATQAGAGVASLAALPDVTPLVVALVAISAEIVAFGVLTGRRELHVVAPVVACAAWLVFAADALGGDATWFVMPIGLTVLIVSALVRWIRRGRGGDVTGYDVVALEFAGMTALVAPALVHTLAGKLWHGVLAIGIGMLIAGWGIVTRVRWRVAFGAGSIVLATILLIAVPLSGAVTWRGPALWITLTVVGVAAITIASVLERSIDRVRRVAGRLDRMTAGWDRIPLRRVDPGGSGPTAPVDDTSHDHRRPVH